MKQLLVILLLSTSTWASNVQFVPGFGEVEVQGCGTPSDSIIAQAWSKAEQNAESTCSSKVQRTSEFKIWSRCRGQFDGGSKLIVSVDAQFECGSLNSP